MFILQSPLEQFISVHVITVERRQAYQLGHESAYRLLQSMPTIAIYHYYAYLLLSLKADTRFTIPRTAGQKAELTWVAG